MGVREEEVVLGTRKFGLKDSQGEKLVLRLKESHRLKPSVIRFRIRLLD